jgi:hypothetical protein
MLVAFETVFCIRLWFVEIEVTFEIGDAGHVGVDVR